MVTIKDQKQGLNSPLKGKKKSKDLSVENFSLRFRRLSEEIFQQVDKQTLVKCKQFNKNWNKIIKDHQIYWFQKIKKLSAKFNDFQNEWKTTPLENFKKLSTILFNIYRKSLIRIRLSIILDLKFLRLLKE